MIFGALGDLAGIFVTWVSGVPGAIAWVVGGIACVFGGLAAKIITAAGDVGKAFSDWFSPVKGIAERTSHCDRPGLHRTGGQDHQVGGLVQHRAGWLAGSRPRSGRQDLAQHRGPVLRHGLGFDQGSGQPGATPSSDWGNAAVREANRVANGIVNQFRGLANDIERAIGTVHIKVVVDMPSIPRPHVTAIVDMPKSLAVSAPAPAGPQATSTGAQATPRR